MFLTEEKKDFKSLMVSSLLGDAYITLNHGKEIMAIQHGNQQKDYLHYKVQLFNNFGLSMKTHVINKSDSRSYIAHRGYFYSENLKYWKHQFYKNGNKIITRHLLNMLNEFGLAIWWMDDGCLSIYKNKITKSTQRYGKLCTHSFTEEENELMRKYFKVKWGIEFRVKKEKNKYFYLYLNANNCNKLFNIIRPFIIDTMKYKIDMKYKNITLQGGQDLADIQSDLTI